MGLAVLFFSVVQYAPNFHIKDKLKRQVRFEWLSEEKKKKYFLLIQCLLDVLPFLYLCRHHIDWKSSLLVNLL
jgi:hypothetical protein